MIERHRIIKAAYPSKVDGFHRNKQHESTYNIKWGWFSNYNTHPFNIVEGFDNKVAYALASIAHALGLEEAEEWTADAQTLIESEEGDILATIIQEYTNTTNVVLHFDNPMNSMRCSALDSAALHDKELMENFITDNTIIVVMDMENSYAIDNIGALGKLGLLSDKSVMLRSEEITYNLKENEMQD